MDRSSSKSLSTFYVDILSRNRPLLFQSQESQDQTYTRFLHILPQKRPNDEMDKSPMKKLKDDFNHTDDEALHCALLPITAGVLNER